MHVERHACRQTDGGGRQEDNQTGRYTEIKAHKQEGRQVGRKAGRAMNWKSGRERDRQACRQA